MHDLIVILVLLVGHLTSLLTACFFGSFITRYIKDCEDRRDIRALTPLIGFVLGLPISICLVRQPWPVLNWFVIPISALVTSIFVALVVLLHHLVVVRTRLPSLPMMRALKAPRPAK